LAPAPPPPKPILGRIQIVAKATTTTTDDDDDEEQPISSTDDDEDDDDSQREQPCCDTVADFGEDYGVVTLDDPSCPICLVDYQHGSEVQRSASCDHLYHTTCIDGWLKRDKKECPCCRSNFYDLDNSNKNNKKEHSSRTNRTDSISSDV